MPTQSRMECLEPRGLFSILPLAPVEVSNGIPEVAVDYSVDAPNANGQTNTDSLSGDTDTSFAKESFTRNKPHISGPYRP